MVDPCSARVEIDADRNALHHLHVVAGRILRREQAEARAGGAADARNVAVILPLVGIHAEPHLLARSSSSSAASP